MAGSAYAKIEAALIPLSHLYSLLLAAGISQSEGKTKERAMKPAIKLLLRRSLMTLGAIVVWAKALAGGAPTGRPSQRRRPIKRKRGVESKSPTVNPNSEDDDDAAPHISDVTGN